MDIDQVIQTQRVENNAASILLLFYLPLGILLVILRVFLTLNYICAQILFDVICSKENVLRRTFEAVFLAVLGVIVIQHDGRLRDRKAILVSNRLTKVDSFFVAVLCNCSVVVKENTSGVTNKLFRSILRGSVENTPTSVLVQPEAYPSGGSALLKFSEWPFNSPVHVQPAAIRLKRILPIAGSTVESTWWQDLLWMYFSLISIFDVTIIQGIRQADDESIEDYADRVRINIAATLGVPCSVFDSSDVEEYLKRSRFEAQRPQQHINPRAHLSPRTRDMVRQVKDILPHVPVAVITSDIQKTSSVDVTVTNLLEGVVKFEPEVVPSSTQSSAASTSSILQKKPSISKTPAQRHMTFQERKDAMLEQARKNYLKKRGVS